MGFFRDLIKRKPTPAPEDGAPKVKVLDTTLEPITINLNSQQFQCNNHGRWCPVAESHQPSGRMQEEVIRLRKEKVALVKLLNLLTNQTNLQEREIIKYARQEQEMKQLKEKLNLMDLKYKVLVEMVRADHSPLFAQPASPAVDNEQSTRTERRLNGSSNK